MPQKILLLQKFHLDLTPRYEKLFKHTKKNKHR